MPQAAIDIGSPPPSPPMRKSRPSLSESLMGPASQEPGAITGMQNVKALEGVALIAKGQDILNTALPGSIPPAVLQFLDSLKSTVPQAVQTLMARGSNPAAAAQMVAQSFNPMAGAAPPMGGGGMAAVPAGPLPPNLAQAPLPPEPPMEEGAPPGVMPPPY